VPLGYDVVFDRLKLLCPYCQRWCRFAICPGTYNLSNPLNILSKPLFIVLTDRCLQTRSICLSTKACRFLDSFCLQLENRARKNVARESRFSIQIYDRFGLRFGLDTPGLYGDIDLASRHPLFQEILVCTGLVPSYQVVGVIAFAD
jgi:hypothetical protein